MSTVNPAAAQPYVPPRQPAAPPPPPQQQPPAPTGSDSDGDNDGSKGVDIKA